MGAARTMRALTLVFLFSMAANGQYPIQAEKGAKVKQSRLSEMSPRAGPDRPRPASVPLSVLTPLTALGGLGRHVTTSQEAQKASHFLQPQIIGLSAGQIGSQVYSLPQEGAVLSQLQKQGVKGGYAVQEPPQEDPPEQTSEGYQFVLERLSSEKSQPLRIHQFQNPLANQHYQNSQVQPLPLFFSSPQQYSQRDQILYSSPISYLQTTKDQAQIFTPHQQIYEEKPNANYIQTNSPISSTTASPPTTIHLASINSASYPSTTEAVFPDLNKQNQEQGLYKDGVAYEVVNPLNYGHSPPYYSFALNEPQKTADDGRFGSVTNFYQNQVPQTTTAKPFLPISRGFPVEYQPQISSTTANVGVSRGIYDSNSALITIGSQGKEIAEPVGLLTYFQQPFLGTASASDSNYNGNQGNLLRNPIEYASPFARQELLELRQKKGFS